MQFMSGGRAQFPSSLGIFCSTTRCSFFPFFRATNFKDIERERSDCVWEFSYNNRPTTNWLLPFVSPSKQARSGRAADGYNCINHYCWLSGRGLPLLGDLHWLSAFEEIGNSDKAFIHRDCSGFGTSVLATSQAIFWCPPDSGYREITPHSVGTSSKMLSAKK